METKTNIKTEEAEALLQKLLNSKKYYFANLKPSDLEDGLPAVYAIFDMDNGENLYVGRTKNLRRRLYTNHLMGPKSNARLKKYLTEDDEVPEIKTMADAKKYLREHCYFQFIPEPDVRRRGQIEGMLGFLLDVRYIHEEH